MAAERYDPEADEDDGERVSNLLLYAYLSIAIFTMLNYASHKICIYMTGRVLDMNKLK